MEIDLSNGLYCIGLNIDDIPKPKLGVVFPTKPGQEPLLTFPLVLLMGWKNSSRFFCTVTETIADLVNQQIQVGLTPTTHSPD